MMETVVADVNASSIPIVSIDLPSGLSADTPHVIGDCIDASMTVTLATPKLPLVLPPGEQHAGDVVIADIGIPHEVIDGVEGRHIELLTPEQLRDLVEPRTADSHKGDFGRGAGVVEFVRALLDRATVPLVLDADAVTGLADDPGVLVGREERAVIITPHPGEMARLIGADVDEVQANRIDVASEFATTH